MEEETEPKRVFGKLTLKDYGAFYAALSGIAAASASVFGKLFSAVEPWYVRAFCFLFMLVSNALVWTLFVRALTASRTSLPATITSAAVNYCCSGVLGWVLFAERTSLLWWAGLTQVLLGLILINAKDKIE